MRDTQHMGMLSDRVQGGNMLNCSVPAVLLSSRQLWWSKAACRQLVAPLGIERQQNTAQASVPARMQADNVPMCNDASKAVLKRIAPVSSRQP